MWHCLIRIQLCLASLGEMLSMVLNGQYVQMWHQFLTKLLLQGNIAALKRLEILLCCWLVSQHLPEGLLFNSPCLLAGTDRCLTPPQLSGLFQWLKSSRHVDSPGILFICSEHWGFTSSFWFMCGSLSCAINNMVIKFEINKRVKSNLVSY